MIPGAVKRVFFFPEGYKKRRHKTVEGVASTGEISQKGLVSHTEDWEGRIEANVQPSTIHMKMLPDGTVRVKTTTELIQEGKYRLGLGPVGVELVHGGIINNE